MKGNLTKAVSGMLFLLATMSMVNFASAGRVFDAVPCAAGGGRKRRSGGSLRGNRRFAGLLR